MISRDGAATIATHRSAQRFVRDALVAVAGALSPGHTERDADRMIRERLSSRIAATRWFHEPYVWFGDRTAPRGRRRLGDFHPSDRRLELGMPVILDAAPYIDGVIADVSYTFACGANAELDRLLGELAAIRARVLELACSRRRPSEIYRAIDAAAAERGYRTCHGSIPLGPLAHRVDQPRAPHLGARVAGVDAGTLADLGARELLARVRAWPRPSPLWTAADKHARRELVGLWSVEPHVARGDVGAKFEEVLVVTDTTADWLDEPRM